MKERLSVIDFLRGFSIFTIALMHLTHPYVTGMLWKAVVFGGAGVHVFILVSGFGLYLSYMRKPLGYSEFLKKRFGKVYWPYAVMVVAWLLWVLVSSGNFMWREALSHLMLYKMFVHDLDVSFCYPYWFISTIIQFYICWPLIVRVACLGGANNKVTGYGLSVSMVISLLWATAVGLLGYEELRPWGSCFLQYLWEFVLGMWLAKKYQEKAGSFDIKNVSYLWLFVAIKFGVAMTGVMASKGGFLKLYNDIPSLLGYLSCALLIYKANIRLLNKFFIWTSAFGFELYLVHSLVYSIINTIGISAIPLKLIISFVLAYVVAYVYHFVLSSNYIKHKKL